MPREKIAQRVQRGVAELQHLIRQQQPDVEFDVHPRRPGHNEVIAEVFGNFEDQLALSEIISQRSVDLLIETGLLFIFLACPYDERPSLRQKQKSA